jgi:hypothetical protein
MIAHLTTVVARSASDEAIHLSKSADMDCFASACNDERNNFQIPARTAYRGPSGMTA